MIQSLREKTTKATKSFLLFGTVTDSARLTTHSDIK